MLRKDRIKNLLKFETSSIPDTIVIFLKAFQNLGFQSRPPFTLGGLKHRKCTITSLVSKLRAERGSLPPLREFSRDTIQKWIEEDEGDLRKFQEAP